MNRNNFDLYFKEAIEETILIKQTDTGYVVSYLVQDNMPESPDSWDDSNVFLVGYHSDFTVTKDDVIIKDLAIDIFNNEKTDEVKAFKKKYHCFGLEAYIHSGVRLAFSHMGNFPDRRWDVSQIGLVCVSKEEFKSKKKAEKCAASLIEEWNQYLSGDVYGIVHERFNEDHVSINDVDSCWGYYGHDYALQTLKEEHEAYK